MIYHARTIILALGLASLLCGCSGSSLHPPKVTAAPTLSDGEYLRRRGLDFAQNGDLIRAEQYLVAALEAGAPSERVLPSLLRVCIDSRRYRVALEHAEDALRVAPKNSTLRFLTGSLYAATGDVTNARSHLIRAASELPTDPNVQFSVGVFSRDLGQNPGQADQYFRSYLALAPHGSHAAEAENALLTRLP